MHVFFLFVNCSFVAGVWDKRWRIGLVKWTDTRSHWWDIFCKITSSFACLSISNFSFVVFFIAIYKGLFIMKKMPWKLTLLCHVFLKSLRKSFFLISYRAADKLCLYFCINLDGLKNCFSPFLLLFLDFFLSIVLILVKISNLLLLFGIP